jgi:hypothetical protein
VIEMKDEEGNLINDFGMASNAGDHRGFIRTTRRPAGCCEQKLWLILAGL